MAEYPPSEPLAAPSILLNISQQRPHFLQLPPEVRLAVYDLLFDNLTARITFFSEQKTQVRYNARTAPAITEVCRLLREEAFPILQRKVLVLVHALHLRTIQERRAIWGRSTAMADIAPILAWATRVQFLCPYNLRIVQPILASCRGLRTITIPVNLNPRGIRMPNAMDDEVCRLIAGEVKATMASYTGLGKRVVSAEGLMTPWADGWIRERVVVTIHIDAFDAATQPEPSEVPCPCGGRGRCDLHSSPWSTYDRLVWTYCVGPADDSDSESVFRWLARRVADRFRRPDPNSPYY